MPIRPRECFRQRGVRHSIVGRPSEAPAGCRSIPDEFTLFQARRRWLDWRPRDCVKRPFHPAYLRFRHHHVQRLKLFVPEWLIRQVDSEPRPAAGTRAWRMPLSKWFASLTIQIAPVSRCGMGGSNLVRRDCAGQKGRPAVGGSWPGRIDPMTPQRNGRGKPVTNLPTRTLFRNEELPPGGASSRWLSGYSADSLDPSDSWLLLFLT